MYEYKGKTYASYVEMLTAAQKQYADELEAAAAKRRARQAARKKSVDPRAKAAYDRYMARFKSAPENKRGPTVAQGRFISILLGGMDAFCPGRDSRYPEGFVTCAEALADMGLTGRMASRFLDTVKRQGIQKNPEACRELLASMGVTCSI